jgi:hypothetical protein
MFAKRHARLEPANHADDALVDAYVTVCAGRAGKYSTDGECGN